MVPISTFQIFVSQICRRSLEVAASLNCLKQVHGTIFEGNTLDTSVTSNRRILCCVNLNVDTLKTSTKCGEAAQVKVRKFASFSCASFVTILWFSSKVFHTLPPSARLSDFPELEAKVQNSSKRKKTFCRLRTCPAQFHLHCSPCPLQQNLLRIPAFWYRS